MVNSVKTYSTSLIVSVTLCTDMSLWSATRMYLLVESKSSSMTHIQDGMPVSSFSGYGSVFSPLANTRIFRQADTPLVKVGAEAFLALA